MTFNSWHFLIFFGLFFSVYVCTSGRLRTAFTLVASYIFYGFWDWRFLGLIVLSTAVDYICGRLMDVATPRQRKQLLWVSVVVNLSILSIFKYLNFFIDSAMHMVALMGLTPHEITLSIILPVGISFYTFQTMSYTIDVYRKRLPVEKNVVVFATYVALFPQLVAGPIVRASTLLPQLHVEPKITWRDLFVGFELILWGYVLKLCLADNAGPIVDTIFAQPEIASSMEHLAAVLAFAFQIYGDFAGYSLIAIGLGRMLGLDFGSNFDTPYFATSFRNFWQRWHISLSSWLRDYLYIPLGGNRAGRFNECRNLVITMLLGGLWHGAAWVFVIWGLLHGFYLILERLTAPFYQLACDLLHLPQWLRTAVAMLSVFILTCFAWIFFRAQNLEAALTSIGKLFDVGGYHLTLDLFSPQLALTVVMVIFVLSIDVASKIEPIKVWYVRRPVLRFAGVLVMFQTILLFGAFTGSRFIYFQF
jgi:D-alanyl-lipoteichoic acid acyltransferase DltB (MBOAT superfamily)